MLGNPSLFPAIPENDFARKKMFPLDALLKFIIWMCGMALPDDLPSYFKDNLPSVK